MWQKICLSGRVAKNEDNIQKQLSCSICSKVISLEISDKLGLLSQEELGFPVTIEVDGKEYVLDSLPTHTLKNCIVLNHQSVVLHRARDVEVAVKANLNILLLLMELDEITHGFCSKTCWDISQQTKKRATPELRKIVLDTPIPQSYKMIGL